MAEALAPQDGGGPGRQRWRAWFGRGRTRALLSVCALLGAGAVATSAYWRDAATVPGTSIQSGAMHLDLGTPIRQKPETRSWPGGSLAGMTPGSTAAAQVTVANNSLGPVKFQFDIRASATNVASGTLASALVMNVVRDGTSNGTACSGADLLGTADRPLNGYSQAAGVTLQQGQTRTFCVQVKLPSTATVAPGSQANLTFTFPAMQVP